jgi:hypothetical protein
MLAILRQRVAMFLMAVVHGSGDFLAHALAVSLAITIKLV